MVTRAGLLKWWNRTPFGLSAEDSENALLAAESIVGAELFEADPSRGDRVSFHHQLHGNEHEWNLFRYHGNDPEPYNTVKYIILSLPEGGRAIRKVYKYNDVEQAYVLDPANRQHVEELRELSLAANAYFQLIPARLYH